MRKKQCPLLPLWKYSNTMASWILSLTLICQDIGFSYPLQHVKVFLKIYKYNHNFICEGNILFYIFLSYANYNTKNVFHILPLNPSVLNVISWNSFIFWNLLSVQLFLQQIRCWPIVFANSLVQMWNIEELTLMLWILLCKRELFSNSWNFAFWILPTLQWMQEMLSVFFLSINL